MSQITTHILDTTTGRPAADVAIVLYRQQANDWTIIAQDITNHDGRITDLLGKDMILAPGTYKMKFDVGTYFERLRQKSLYPFVEILFTIDSSGHYHIPLLLNPFGYTTYRGS